MKKFKDLASLKTGDKHVVVVITDQAMMRGTDFRKELTLFLGAQFNSNYARV